LSSDEVNAHFWSLNDVVEMEKETFFAFCWGTTKEIVDEIWVVEWARAKGKLSAFFLEKDWVFFGLNWETYELLVQAKGRTVADVPAQLHESHHCSLVQYSMNFA
jgi:hypothetical protein